MAARVQAAAWRIMRASLAIDTQELRAKLTTMGEPLTDEEVTELVAHADKDGSGYAPRPPLPLLVGTVRLGRFACRAGSRVALLRRTISIEEFKSMECWGLGRPDGT